MSYLKVVEDSTFPRNCTGLINGIAYGRDKFVAVGSNGRIAYSMPLALENLTRGEQIL